MIFNQQKDPFIITKELEIDGMSSENCAEKIENILKITRGIQVANVDFENKTLTVTYDKNITDTDKIKQLVNRLGYSVPENT